MSLINSINGEQLEIQGPGGQVPIFFATIPGQNTWGLYTGNGTPNGVVTASSPSLFFDVVDGALWFKTSFSGNTGWIIISLNAGTTPIASLAPIASDTILGNNTGGSATPSALTQAQVTALLNVFTSSLKGLVPNSGGGTTNFLRADGSFAAPSGTGINQLTGDVTAGPGSGPQAATVGKLQGSIALSGTPSSGQVLTATGSTAADWQTPSGGTGLNQLTGDVTAGPGSGSQIATLANTSVVASTYGDATNVPQITVDAKGRLTGVTQVAITPAADPAWTGYVPSTTNLTTVSTIAAHLQNGKSVKVRIGVGGTSNGSVPTISLPFTVVSPYQTFACTITLAGTTVPGCVSVSGSTLTVTIYNASAYAPATAYVFIISGEYEST